MTEQTEILLRDLAQTLGTTVEQLWPVLCRQAVIEGWLTIAGLTAYFACTAYGLWWALHREPASVFFDDSAIIPCAAGGVALSMALMLFIGPGMIAAILNPDYWALQKLLSMIK